MNEQNTEIELKDERIILVYEQGSDSVTVERQTWGRSDGVPTYYVRLAPHDVLDAGYDEAVVRLDQKSIDRLRHWLLTGEALPRGVEVPDPIATTAEYGVEIRDTDHPSAGWRFRFGWYADEERMRKSLDWVRESGEAFDARLVRRTTTTEALDHVNRPAATTSPAHSPARENADADGGAS